LAIIHAGTNRRAAPFRDMFNMGDDLARGRSIVLASTLLGGIYNVFITGIFQTLFLSAYGITLIDMGVITFIPLFANCFCVFTPVILARFTRRKYILAASKAFFYFLYIIAVMIMPLFVKELRQRVLWFGVILFIAYSINALFSAGYTPWFYNFFPRDNERRARFFYYNQVLGSMIAGVAMVLSSLAAKRLAGSNVISILRYAAFALVLIDILIQCSAREYPYPAGDTRIRFREIFTFPLRHRKFMLCLAVIFAWNYACSLNSGLWVYYLLNTAGLSYVYINVIEALAAIWVIAAAPAWRRAIANRSWTGTFMLTLLLWLPTEMGMSLVTQHTRWLWGILRVAQQIIQVGINLSYANLFYLNLPEDNRLAHTSFHSLGCNLAAGLGLVTGTWLCAVTGSSVLWVLGLPVTSAQMTTWLKSFVMVLLIVFLALHRREMEPVSEVISASS
jgi:hypothetical protein